MLKDSHEGLGGRSLPDDPIHWSSIADAEDFRRSALVVKVRFGVLGVYC